MAILLLAEHDNHFLSIETAKSLQAALQIGEEVDILIAGEDVLAVAEKAATLEGVRQILIANAVFLQHQLAEPLSKLLFSLAKNYNFLIAPATTTGKNVMPRLAALLGVMQISDVIAILSADTFKRPTYAGSVIATVQSLDQKKVITVRTSSFSPVSQGNQAPLIEIDIPEDHGFSYFISASEKNQQQDLSSARVILSGGRGFASAENFNTLLKPLALRLNAAIGASRAAVDAGYAPNDLQIGQTGKIVSPELYIAIGISGSVQHLAGITNSRVIVAINKDPNAPIFKVADYGLVGDLFKILPELINLL